MKPKHELQRLADECRAQLKKVMQNLGQAEEAAANIPQDRWPLTWPEMSINMRGLKERAGSLRADLDDYERALKERRPAIVRVYLDDLGLDELEG